MISTSLVAPTSSLKRDNPKGSASAGGGPFGDVKRGGDTLRVEIERVL